jgi:hypothetical protein
VSDLALSSTLAWLAVVLSARIFRSRAYAIFRGVALGLHTLIAVPLFAHAGPIFPLALVLHGAVYADSLFLIRPNLRPLWFRLLVSWPAQYAVASTFMAFPWAIAVAFGFEPRGLFLPYIFGLLGMVQSFTSRVESKEIVVGKVDDVAKVARVFEGHRHAGGGLERPLRVAQITDPHLGPFMSVARLKGICQRVVDQDPDLVFLTGDFMTMESQADDACSARRPRLRVHGQSRS